MFGKKFCNYEVLILREITTTFSNIFSLYFQIWTYSISKTWRISMFCMCPTFGCSLKYWWKNSKTWRSLCCKFTNYYGNCGRIFGAKCTEIFTKFWNCVLIFRWVLPTSIKYSWNFTNFFLQGTMQWMIFSQKCQWSLILTVMNIIAKFYKKDLLKRRQKGWKINPMVSGEHSVEFVELCYPSDFMWNHF